LRGFDLTILIENPGTSLGSIGTPVAKTAIQDEIEWKSREAGSRSGPMLVLPWNRKEDHVSLNFKSSTRILLGGLMILAFGLVPAGCGSGDQDQGNSGAGQAENGNLSIGGEKGNQAPEFQLARLQGSDLSLADLRGKVVILDFWDTWCPPCREAMPELQKLSETYRDDLVVVGVAIGREGQAKVQDYVQKHGLTFEMVLLNNDMELIKRLGGIASIPTTFLVDREGVIQAKWVGYEPGTFEKPLQRVIGS